MKKHLLSLVLGLGLLGTAVAADEKSQHTYEGAITGVVCTACKQHITAALTQNLPGVVSVDVKVAENDAKKLTVVATNPDVTKEAVMAALGTYAKNYKVLNLEKKN